jgi:hypothetical protein
MKPAKKHSLARPIEIPRLTIDDIDTQDSFRNLSVEEKLELILFIYHLSLVLYHSYSEGDE